LSFARIDVSINLQSLTFYDQDRNEGSHQRLAFKRYFFACGRGAATLDHFSDLRLWSAPWAESHQQFTSPFFDGTCMMS